MLCVFGGELCLILCVVCVLGGRKALTLSKTPNKNAPPRQFVAYDWRLMELAVALSKYVGEGDPLPLIQGGLCFYLNFLYICGRSLGITMWRAGRVFVLAVGKLGPMIGVRARAGVGGLARCPSPWAKATRCRWSGASLSLVAR